MNSQVKVRLNTTPEQSARLMALQRAFAEVCNALVPLVRQTRIWNRVALHHMAYRGLREQFPALGSQMVCNAIYSVSRSCRLVFQSPDSPFHLSRLGDRALPMMRFLESSPVYFDRHTLSIKDGQVSMYTLDGRMRFELALQASDANAFHHHKLYEIILQFESEAYFLSFRFGEAQGAENIILSENHPKKALEPTTVSALPEYVQIEEAK
jgi:hypothetical protein